MVNTAVRNTSVERADSLESMAEALQLFSLGYDNEIIKNAVPDISVKFLRDNCQTSKYRLAREKPKGLFSQETVYRDKRRFIFATVFKYFESSEMVTGLLDKLPEKMNNRPVFKLTLAIARTLTRRLWEQQFK